MRFIVFTALGFIVLGGCATEQIHMLADEVRCFDGTRDTSYTRTATPFGWMHRAFNQAGREIWSQEDVRRSYSVTSTLSFYSHNQLQSAIVRTSPDAGIDWYETVYAWDSLGRITREEHQVSGILSSAIYTTYDPDGTPRQSIACAAPGLREWETN
jgi:hypothetical protein